MLNIVAPIAGKSYFFDNEKDGFPKPFIEICGKTMLEHFVKNYENVKNKRFIFILKEEDVKRYFTFYSHAKINEYERIKNA